MLGLARQESAGSPSARAGASSTPERLTALVVALPPYAHSHRAGKIARSYARSGPTAYLALAAAGRSAPADEPGDLVADGIRVTQVPIRSLARTATPLTPFRNLLGSYLPALVRMARTALRTPAGVVHVSGTYLLPLGVLHRRRYRSRLVLDVDERPGSSQHRGSVARLVRPFELWLLRRLGPHADLVVVVCENHRDLVRRSLPATTPTTVVRNVPEARVRSAFAPPPPLGPGQPVVFTSVGSVFEGRAFEVLVQACGLLARDAAPVRVRVVGHGHPRYVATLQELSRAEGAQGVLEFTGRVAPEEVAGAYAVAHVGLALYEPSLRHNDSLPNKVLEAVSYGRPVLATGQPDTAAFLTETRTGWTADYSAHALAAEMSRLAAAITEGTIDLDALCRRCRTLGDEELTWEREFAPVLGPVAARATRPEPGAELSRLP